MSEVAQSGAVTSGAKAHVERELAALRDLATAARRLDRSGFEELTPIEYRTRIAPAVAKLGELARHVVGRLQATYDTSSEDGVDEEFCEAPPDEVSDTLFIARLQLSQAIEEIERRSESTEHWDLVAQCNRLRGMITSAGAVIGRAICAREGLSSENGISGGDLRQALLIRRIYTAVHAVVFAVADPPPGRIRERLLAIEDLLRQVLNSGLAQFIRINDRVQLRRLQERMRVWLDQGISADLSDGAHLWQDASAVAEMMVQINNRQELIEHDRQYARLLLGRLVAADDHAAIAPDVLELISELQGRDRDLDAALQDAEALLHRRLVPQLRAVLSRL
ncbi:MAG: hypothetical protein U0V87_09195 [Acidobacteriota bacterium]